MNRYALVSTLVMVVLALSQFLLQPDNLSVWASPKVAGVVLGGIAVVCGVVQNQLPRVQDKPPPDGGK